MPMKTGLAAMMIAMAAAAAVPAAGADDPTGRPQRRDGATALSPRPGTADTVVPGEAVTGDEADARIGWLLLTYVAAVRTSLPRDNPQRTADEMARARAALADLERRLGTGAHRLVLPVGFAANLATAADALTHGDVAASDRALGDCEQGLHATLAAFDAARPGASR